MTIKFRCPNCDNLIAFADKHIGRTARCMGCQRHLIIPAEDDGKVVLIKEKVVPDDPIDGFTRALFIDNWKVFVNKTSVVQLVFVTAVVCFKFFLARFCCCNLVSYVICWGLLMGFYLNVIYETAFGENELPEIYLGTMVEFWWNIIRPFFVFTFTLFVVLLPFVVALSIFHEFGTDYNFYNVWKLEFGWVTLMQVLFCLGLFIFPMAILIVAIAKDYTALLRPDYYARPICKAFWPYVAVVFFLGIFCFVEIVASMFVPSESILVTAAGLALNLLVQVFAIVAMRAIGLFYRHYSCYLGW